MTRLLGGSAHPLGGWVQYVQLPCDELLADLRAWRSGLGKKLKVSRARPYPEVLDDLVPFEAPWTRELLMPCGDGWTAYLNNSVNGGDPTAAAAHLAAQRNVRCVIAGHSVPDGSGHGSTQLWVHGPDGEPPLMYERTLAAHCEDGRWKWLVSGTPFPFEETERYAARLVRDRLDRDLLLRYLGELGIPAGDDDAYGPGVVVQQKVSWKRRTVTLEEARAEDA